MKFTEKLFEPEDEGLIGVVAVEPEGATYKFDTFVFIPAAPPKPTVNDVILTGSEELACNVYEPSLTPVVFGVAVWSEYEAFFETVKPAPLTVIVGPAITDVEGTVVNC